VDFVGHQTVFAPEALFFMEMVRSHKVTEWRSWRTSTGSGDNPYLDLAVHDIALRRVTLGVEVPGVVKHRAKYADESHIHQRATEARVSTGERIVLDELSRTVTLYEKPSPYRVRRYFREWTFDAAPDPLGVELRAWARGTGISLDVAAAAADEALVGPVEA
jgi:hypothetical protein